LMKRQERRGAESDGELSNPAWIEEERPESTEQPVAQRQVGRPPASAAPDDGAAGGRSAAEDGP
jgi:hypothetical protein